MSGRFTRAFNSSGAARAVHMIYQKRSTGFGMLASPSCGLGVLARIFS